MRISSKINGLRLFCDLCQQRFTREDIVHVHVAKIKYIHNNTRTCMCHRFGMEFENHWNGKIEYKGKLWSNVWLAWNENKLR